MKKPMKSIFSLLKIFLGWIKQTSFQKFTIMFVPHSGKRLITFQIHYITIMLLFLLTTTIVMLSIFLAPELESTQKNLQSMSDNNKRMISLYNTLNQEIEKVAESTDQLNHTTDQFMREIDQTPGNYPSGIGGETFSILDYESQDGIVRNETETLRLLRTQIDTADNKMSSLFDYVVAIKELMNTIPSIHPLFGRGIMMSPFGPRRHPITGKIQQHEGIDIADIPGTPVRATAKGRIKEAQFAGGAGLMIEIEHSYRFSTRYLHLSVIGVEVGQEVRKGQVIGRVGNTGLSVGPHLHYEVRVNNIAINPAPYVGLDQSW